MKAAEYLRTLNSTRFFKGVCGHDATMGFPRGEDVAQQTVTEESLRDQAITWPTGPQMVPLWALGWGVSP